MPIVWTMPDGSVRVTQLTDSYLATEQREGESTEQAVLRLAEVIRVKNPDLAGGTPSLVKSADMPKDRSKRDKWKLDGAKVTETRV